MNRHILVRYFCRRNQFKITHEELVTDIEQFTVPMEVQLIKENCPYYFESYDKTENVSFIKLQHVLKSSFISDITIHGAEGVRIQFSNYDSHNIEIYLNKDENGVFVFPLFLPLGILSQQKAEKFLDSLTFIIKGSFEISLTSLSVDENFYNSDEMYHAKRPRLVDSNPLSIVTMQSDPVIISETCISGRYIYSSVFSNLSDMVYFACVLI